MVEIGTLETTVNKAFVDFQEEVDTIQKWTLTHLKRSLR